MIDFHTHVLPEIDDGSRDIQMTREMLMLEKEQGVNLVVATPHFYAHRTRVDQFLQKRENALNKVRALKSEEPGLPEIKAGAEVYYFTGIGRAEHIKELSIQGTDYMLMELPFRPWDREVLTDIKELKSRQHLKVILAHVERYRDMQKDKSLYEDVLDAGDIIQMNSGSFTEAGILKRGKLFKIADSGRKMILGSDCHNMSSRKPNLQEGLDLIEKKLGEDKVREIKENLEVLFR